MAFSYAALSLAEGIGLYLEKAWGELLTLAITASFLPWEIFEIFHRLTWVRVGLLVINVLVFFYLLKLVASRKQPIESRQSANFAFCSPIYLSGAIEKGRPTPVPNQ